MALIEFYDDTRYSLQKDTALSRITIHIIAAFSLIFATNGFLFNGFEGYNLESAAALFYLGVSVLSILLVFILNHVNCYPFLYVCVSILSLAVAGFFVGVDGNGPLLILVVTVLFLLHYMYLITTTDFENPRPKNSNEKIFPFDGSDKTRSISGFVFEGNFNKMALGVAFGKAFLLGITGMNLLMSLIELLI